MIINHNLPALNAGRNMGINQVILLVIEFEQFIIEFR